MANEPILPAALHQQPGVIAAVYVVPAELYASLASLLSLTAGATTEDSLLYTLTLAGLPNSSDRVYLYLYDSRHGPWLDIQWHRDGKFLASCVRPHVDLSEPVVIDGDGRLIFSLEQQNGELQDSGGR